jgi:hypothetical protein
MLKQHKNNLPETVAKNETRTINRFIFLCFLGIKIFRQLFHTF